ncbi:MAG TPA: 8-amino-7-oxononanoate synthase [Rhodospirillales bacterium]|nr:8-amino-7-oxononanoate synthase [Rhodospirillales bacterium]
MPGSRTRRHRTITTALQRLTRDLERLRAEFRYRSLNLPGGVDFTSNDYLGLSRHPALAEAAREALATGPMFGAAGSRLLRGHHPDHAELEAFAAEVFAAEKALYMSTGFVANYTLFTALAQRGDAIVFDEYIHASAKEGIHASHARRYKARHNDAASFAEAAWRARRRGARQLWITVESVYSMDGDLAPLCDLVALAEDLDAILIVDEAHATGIFGPRGRGLSEGLDGERLITLHTCGKALGCAGALVCGPAVIIDYLINTARPFIYSTAPPPLVAAVVKRALELIDEEPWRRERLRERTGYARACLRTVLGEAQPFPDSQILPVILGGADRAVGVAGALQAGGYDVRAIRPPTVPADTSRLRLTINALHTDEEIAGLADCLGQVLAAMPEASAA